MPRLDWRTALKALAGFLTGLALWVVLTPLYDRVIGAGAEATLRAFESPSVTRLHREADGYTTVDRSDFDPRSKQRPTVAIKDLTFNFVLLAALFAIAKRPFSDRNIGGFLAASAALAVTHVGATIAEVMSIYVAKLGIWSTVHYGETARNIWGVTATFYRVVLMYAIVFALWFVFRDPGAAPVPKKKKRAR
ncbi:MAG: hypothetical protein JO197_18560 [Acidobacteria bacterium]|nr:hypothetical protein [Acidobacteriota bacterium]MBV9479107.1 hypothetical protein [Acidobacteriota bacterium]